VLSGLSLDRQNSLGQHRAKQLCDTAHPLVLEQMDHLAQFFPEDSIRNGAFELRRTIAAAVAEQFLIHVLAGQASALHVDAEGLAAVLTERHRLWLDGSSAAIADGKDGGAQQRTVTDAAVRGKRCRNQIVEDRTKHCGCALSQPIQQAYSSATVVLSGA